MLADEAVHNGVLKIPNALVEIDIVEMRQALAEMIPHLRQPEGSTRPVALGEFVIGKAGMQHDLAPDRLVDSLEIAEMEGLQPHLERL